MLKNCSCKVSSGSLARFIVKARFLAQTQVTTQTISSTITFLNSTSMSSHPIVSFLHGPRPSSPNPSIQSIFLELQKEKMGVPPAFSTFVRSSIGGPSYPYFSGFECNLECTVRSFRLNDPCFDNTSWP